MKLFHKIIGQGEPLVIVHGLFGSSDNWRRIAKELSSVYQVLLLDLRNHGRSAHHELFDYEVMAQDVADLLTENWIFKTHILGHSMGAKVAMQLCIDHPDLIKQLVCIDMGVKAYKPKHHLILNALCDLNLQVANRAQLDHQLSQTITNKNIRQFLLKNLKRKAKEGYQWKINLPVIKKNYTNILKAITTDEIIEIPTLFIRGANSDYIVDEDWAGILKVFSRAELVTMADAGHWIHTDQPTHLINLLKTRLKV